MENKTGKSVNCMQQGETYECSNCCPDKGYANCQTLFKDMFNGNGTPMKCECKCHKWFEAGKAQAKKEALEVLETMDERAYNVVEKIGGKY